MKRSVWTAVLLLAGLVCVPKGNAQEQGYWRAESNTAHSITGDISLGSEKMMINFSTFTMFRARPLKPEEYRATFDLPADATGAGALYKVVIPGDKKFLHHNTLCGAEDVEWMTTFTDGKLLHVIFFSGKQLPVFTHEAMLQSTQVCGTFLYSR